MTPPTDRITAAGNGFHADADPDDDLRRDNRQTREIMHSILRRNGCRVIQSAFIDRDRAAHTILANAERPVHVVVRRHATPAGIHAATQGCHAPGRSRILR